MPLNYLRTALLLAVLTAIFVAAGFAIGGTGGMVIAFVVALGINLFSYWNSDKMVLRMHNAQEVDAGTAPELHAMVRQLAANAGLPMPRVYVMHTPQPNAFATGRNPENSAVCASTGLLETLSREEVAGVMAHEIAHIKNRDTLTMTMAATIGGAITMLAQLLQFRFLTGSYGRNDNRFGLIGALFAMLVAPFAAMLVQMAISRSREYTADRLGAMICGNPLWLASALARIHNAVQRSQGQREIESNPAAAHLFIINPLTGRGFDSMFSTHPSTENRVYELEKLAREWAAQGRLQGDGGDNGRLSPGLAPPEAGDSRRRGPWG